MTLQIDPVVAGLFLTLLVVVFWTIWPRRVPRTPRAFREREEMGKTPEPAPPRDAHKVFHP